MKAILLAGGKGTRLRPLTLHTPKPVVPIFDRAFLHYQIDLLRQLPDIDEVILSLNYQPRRIEEVFGDGTGTGVRIRYVVEPSPLGTGGAIRYAAQGVTDTVVVFNGDVMTNVDLAAVVSMHRERQAKATIVLTPVDNPTAYGLVETDSDGRVRRFLEKPNPDEITCDTINAGIYVLEPDTFDRIPKDVSYSIERAYFPSLIERNERFLAYIDRGYWIDIGTPEKYVQVHRDMFDGKFGGGLFGSADHSKPIVSAEARIDEGAVIEGPCFIDAGAHIKKGAKIGPYSVIGRGVLVEEDADLRDTIIWPNSRIGQSAVVHGPIIGRNCHIGRNAVLKGQSVIGDKSQLTDFTTA
ncbi:MAG TPA: NDP-sugar synthase [Vicinamibacterales bacterium]|nr:NDP-sugar synthase [Vicinamibacterales bacterium]